MNPTERKMAAAILRFEDSRVTGPDSLRVSRLPAAYKGGKWIPIHWGSLGASTAGVSDAQKAMYANEPEVLRMLQLPGNGFIKCMRTFDPVTTNRLRVKLFQKGGKVRLAELHVYKANAAKNMALRS